jgi:hypothetical protein
MMVHPPADLIAIWAIAIQQLLVSTTARPPTRRGAPWDGRNALDAAVLGYMNVAALRQHIRPDERIHGIFTEAGDKPNIVPNRAATHWYVRSGHHGRRCSRSEAAGARRAGGRRRRHRVHDEPPVGRPAYADMVDNEAMIDLLRGQRGAVGPHRDRSRPRTGGGGQHRHGQRQPPRAVDPPDDQGVPAGVPIHTAEFARFAGSEAGDRAVIDGAKAMADRRRPVGRPELRSTRRSREFAEKRPRLRREATGRATVERPVASSPPSRSPRSHRSPTL